MKIIGVTTLMRISSESARRSMTCGKISCKTLATRLEGLFLLDPRPKESLKYISQVSMTAQKTSANLGRISKNAELTGGVRGTPVTNVLVDFRLAFSRAERDVEVVSTGEDLPWTRAAYPDQKPNKSMNLKDLEG
jgi:hypothetical protein